MIILVKGAQLLALGKIQNTETEPSLYKTMTHSLDTVEPPLGRHPRAMVTGSECSLGIKDFSIYYTEFSG